MKKAHLIALLLAGTISCATLQTAKSVPMTQRAPILKGPIFKGDTARLPQHKLLIEPIPLMTDAVNYAKIGRVGNNGAKAAIYATVIIASTKSQFTPGRQTIRYANGVMRLLGTSGLVGDLVEYSNISRGATVFVKRERATFRLVVRADGSASITSTSRALKKLVTLKADFKPAGTSGMLWGMADYGGTSSLISIGLTKGVDPLENSAAPPVVTPPVVAAPASPRGMRVRVGGEIHITNSDDGVADGTVEMFGNINFNNQEMWKIKRSSAQDGKKGNVILLDYITCNVDFNNPSTWILKVSGYLYDRDMSKGDVIIRGDDFMWNPSSGKYNQNRKIYEIDLKKMVEQQSTETILYGDGDSENANVKIKIRKLSDIN